MAEDFERLFAQVRGYGWDDEKRDRVLRERGIDFEELRFLFEGPTVAVRSDRSGEARYMVCGFLDGRELVVVCTLRGRYLMDHNGATGKAR
jgi:uncharacterized DUF497 family protein